MVEELRTTSIIPTCAPVDKQPYGFILELEGERERERERESKTKDDSPCDVGHANVPEVQACLLPLAVHDSHDL